MTIEKNILINCSIGETRMALTEDGNPAEIRLFRDHSPSYVGAIFLGRVIKLSSELQAAFVELDNKLTGFLPLKSLPRGRGKKPKDMTSLLHDGQRIIVQVTADAPHGKSLKLTGRVELISTAIILHPFREGAFVSSRIKDPDRRAALKEFGQSINLGEMGLTFRTEAENVPFEQLKTTAEKLINHWRIISKDPKHSKCPDLLTQGPVAIEQIMREFTTADISNIIIDDTAALKTAALWAQSFAPELTDKIIQYKENTPLFSHYEIDDQLEQITSSEVALDSGAWITIEGTEALTVIDVNMGRARISRDQNKQIFNINREAAREVFKQLRLRGLGGLIVIDFIDMTDKGHMKSLLHFVDELMLIDPEPVQRGNISSFGLLELTRRSRQRPLNDLLLERTMLKKNVTAKAMDLLRDAENHAKQRPGLPVPIKVSAEVKKWLEDHSNLLDDFKKRTASELIMELK